MRVRWLLIFSILISNPAPAEAVLGGSSGLDNPYVIAILRDRAATTSGGCSGALVAPRVVFTAAHCLGGSARNIWIPQPGSDLKDTTTLRIQAETFMVPSNFSSGKFPYDNDFGIIVLSEAFPNVKTLTIATVAQIKEWTSRESSVLHIGYGCTELVESPPCQKTSTVPNQFETNLLNQIPSQLNSLTPGTFTLTKIAVNKTICGGDSGSPLLRKESGEWIYIGAQSSSNGAGCTKTCNDPCAASQGVASAQQELLQRLEAYLNTSAPTPTQTQSSNNSQTPNPSPSPIPSTSSRPIETSPSPTAIPSPTKVKSQTIICVKGKVTKRVTAINPKCPKGYSRK